MQSFVTGLTLAPTTVRVVFQHLNALLDAAVEDRLIMANPAKGVKLPELSGPEVVPPTVERVQAIYEAAPEWFRPAVLLGAGLGLRQAEASGLTVDRIDWLGRSVRVDRQWITRPGRAEWGSAEDEGEHAGHPGVAVPAGRPRGARRPPARGVRPPPGRRAGGLQRLRPLLAPGDDRRRGDGPALPRASARLREHVDRRGVLSEGGAAGAGPRVGGDDAQPLRAHVAGR